MSATFRQHHQHFCNFQLSSFVERCLVTPNCSTSEPPTSGCVFKSWCWAPVMAMKCDRHLFLQWSLETGEMLPLIQKWMKKTRSGNHSSKKICPRIDFVSQIFFPVIANFSNNYWSHRRNSAHGEIAPDFPVLLIIELFSETLAPIPALASPCSQWNIHESFWNSRNCQKPTSKGFQVSRWNDRYGEEIPWIKRGLIVSTKVFNWNVEIYC